MAVDVVAVGLAVAAAVVLVAAVVLDSAEGLQGRAEAFHDQAAEAVQDRRWGVRRRSIVRLQGPQQAEDRDRVSVVVVAISVPAIDRRHFPETDRPSAAARDQVPVAALRTATARQLSQGSVRAAATQSATIVPGQEPVHVPQRCPEIVPELDRARGLDPGPASESPRGQVQRAESTSTTMSGSEWGSDRLNCPGWDLAQLVRVSETRERDLQIVRRHWKVGPTA